MVLACLMGIRHQEICETAAVPLVRGNRSRTSWTLLCVLLLISSSTCKWMGSVSILWEWLVVSASLGWMSLLWLREASPHRARASVSLYVLLLSSVELRLWKCLWYMWLCSSLLLSNVLQTFLARNANLKYNPSCPRLTSFNEFPSLERSSWWALVKRQSDSCSVSLRLLHILLLLLRYLYTRDSFLNYRCDY